MNYIQQEEPKSICQSCSMPLRTADDFGNEANGTRSRDYCAYCYRNGAFIMPKMSMDQMRDFCVERMVELDVMPRDQALAWMREALPKLKRWVAAKA